MRQFKKRHLTVIVTLAAALGVLALAYAALGLNVTKVPGAALSAEAAEMWKRGSYLDLPVAQPTTVAPPVQTTPAPVEDHFGETDTPAPTSTAEAPTSDADQAEVDGENPTSPMLWIFERSGVQYTIQCSDVVLDGCEPAYQSVWNVIADSDDARYELFVEAEYWDSQYSLYDRLHIGLKACAAHYDVSTGEVTQGAALQELTNRVIDYPDIKNSPELIKMVYADAGSLLCPAWP